MQAIIYFKNGKIDWIDPIENEDKIVYKEKQVFIDNGYFVYAYNTDDIDCIEIIVTEED